MDKARTHRAQQELHSERDRLLKRADKRIGLTGHRGDGKDNARRLLWTFALLILPAIAYTSIMLAWFLVFHDSIVKFLVFFVGYMALGVILAALSYPWLTGKGRPWMWWMGFYTVQAAIAALVVGFFLYYRNLVYYFKWEEMRAYTNVAAAQDNAAFPDASMYLFTEDTRLDTARAVGYKSRWTGQVYCVAPLVDPTMDSVQSVYYWAIGEDCCEKRADFKCGDAQDPSTRSGLVALKPSDIVRPYMRWAVRGSPYERFENAVKLEEATYTTQAADQPTFIYWTRDPVALKDSFYQEAKGSCVLWSLVYFAVLLVIMYISSVRLLPQRKTEGVLRYAD
ncbi:unnamed protein product [Effrenium voratum]|nr:unnamed protein product [Effrenium voratum]